jgi:hypothetical protein
MGSPMMHEVRTQFCRLPCFLVAEFAAATCSWCAVLLICTCLLRARLSPTLGAFLDRHDCKRVVFLVHVTCALWFCLCSWLGILFVCC